MKSKKIGLGLHQKFAEQFVVAGSKRDLTDSR